MRLSTSFIFSKELLAIKARWRFLFLLFSCFCSLSLIYGQDSSQKRLPALPQTIFSVGSSSFQQQDIFGNQGKFIENIGQYGKRVEGLEQMGDIQFAYEGFYMPVLFTSKGLIHLHRKIDYLTAQEELRREANERKRELKRQSEKGKKSEEDEEEEAEVTDRRITMEWLNANPSVQIIAEELADGYNTYGSIKGKAKSYRRIIYKNLYKGVDLVYHFDIAKPLGYEYSLVVRPGADIASIRMKFGGQVKGVRLQNGKLVVRSSIASIEESIPVSFYGTDPVSAPSSKTISTEFEIDGREVYFKFPNGYDRTQSLVIDPFVTGTGNLVGLNQGKAKDVDFDYAGNIYITGGGSGVSSHQLAKFNAAGVLQWTFNGVMTVPSWTFGTYWGGWMVEKPSGNIYLGQGFNPSTGFQVIRVNTNGLYDNFITNANANFREAWKMYWSCNNGSPQILVAGGGTNSNINFGVFTPPATAIGSLNVTGIPYTGSAGWAQDIADFIIDPATNDMYTIYASLFGNPSLNNRIYKNSFPYSGASVVWNVASGFNTLQEVANRPYLVGGSIDNAANLFAINGSYLYYWDGKNLKAFNKATGAQVGSVFTTANTALMQGGIVADACNNVFIGDATGTIKVYNFDGNAFNDGAAPDIAIAGFNGKAIYDLAYDESKKLIYASGDGFVGSFDVSSYCPSSQYNLQIVPNCLTASATVTVNPAPLAGSTIVYVLYNGTTQISSNTTGIFTGLSPNITYTVVATINQLCSGAQATANFILPGPTLTATATPTTCGNNTGTISVSATGSSAPYTYSLDGVNYQPGSVFSNLAAGVYKITVKDANGCTNTITVTVLNSNGPQLTFSSTNADCGSNNGSITATVTGGTAPYQYSLDGIVFQSGNFFTGLVGGTYTLTVRDAAGCKNAAVVTITSSPRPSITATPAAATCGSNNGTITAFGTGGTAPLEYSINGNIFQAGNVFGGLLPGTYTVTVRDINGCIQTTTVVLGNSPAPTVTAISTAASCLNANGTITATGTGGIAPLQYSIDGFSFQSGNIFTGLAAGTYIITVKDATGCTNTVSVTVNTLSAPGLTASSTVSTCVGNTGTITIVGSGGTVPYQYSINGTFFQASGLFTGLAAGNYIAYVRDANGCISTTPITVANTAGPSLTVTVTPTGCGVNNGTITANGTGGLAPLQYSIDGVNYQASNLFTGLSTGVYTVFVKDANGCISSVTRTVTNTSGLSFTIANLSSSCTSNSGTITVNATGGLSPLQYSIDGITYQASNVFSNLGAGVYTVYVKDASGCIVTKQTTIASTTGPSLSVTIRHQATCGGSNGVVAAVGSGGTAPYTYNVDGGAFQPSGIFINLAPGNHTFIVKDALGCTSPAQVITITNSGAGTVPTDVTFTVRDVLSCTGGFGRIKNLKGVPSGGGAKYDFSLDGGPFTTANQFINVPAGTHTITARNEDGCTVTRIAVIGLGTPATATATSTPSTCGASTGTITITGQGAQVPYHASIDNGITWVSFFPPGPNAYTFTGLAPGTYPIQIADDADFTAGPPDDPGACVTTIYVSVASTGGPSISTTIINASCNSSTGSITALGSGGTAPYTYSINGSAYQPSGVFNNLAPGVYAVSVMDGTGCTTGANVTVAGSPTPNPTVTVSPANCNNNNGTITVSVAGGVAPFEYSINGTSFQASNIFTGLAPGSYTVYASDANHCFGTVTVTIANIAMPKVTAFTVAATCNNNDGSIVATGTLGTPPYQFSLNGTAYQSNNNFDNLGAGFYTVYIKDSRGCITTTGVSLTNSQAPVINNAAVVPANCGNPAGSITITASGGTGALQYSINGIVYQASNLFTGLLPGNYSVYVKDANGCLSAKAVVVGNLNGPQTLTAVVIDAACGLNNGTITANASGETPGLQYSINGTTYQASNVFNGLIAGNYTLYVRDANNCVKSIPVTVLNLSAASLAVSTSPSSCGSSDGTITVEVTGGTGTLGYSRDGVNFQASNVFTGLPAGTYTITVRDARNCISTAVVVINTVGSSLVPTFDPVAPICAGATLVALPTTSTNGITGTWTPALNNTATTTYTFTPNAGQCATTTTLTITVNPNITPTFNAVAPICSGATIAALPTTSTNGITGTWTPALNNTATTTYTFTPTAGQCATTTTLTIIVNPNITPTFNAIAPICSGATIAALPTTSTNGITGTWTPALNNAATTTYTFTPDAGQCATTTTLTITVNPNITPTFNAIDPICSGATLAALPTTSANGITGTWTPALNNTATTTYTFTPDAGQCATTMTLTVTVNPIVAPTINCGVSTTNSVSFNWSAIAGATNYSISYIINGGAPVIVGLIGNLLTYQVNGLNGADVVVITVNPIGAGCSQSAQATCIATACTPPTATISYSGPFCSNLSVAQPVTINGTGTYTGGVFSSTPGLSIDPITGAIIPSTSTAGSYIVTYTLAGVGGCPGINATASVTITASVMPAFNTIAPICSGAALTALPTTSLNGITGTWIPVLNNTATTTYTFTPTAGQCATTTTLTIIVNPNIIPTFNAIAPICSGALLAALPTTSTNGIIGTWTPALNNTATTVYTFTPTAGQCATSTTLTITVNPIVAPTINCGVSTTSSVSFNWSAIVGATDYAISYTINGGAANNVGPIGNVVTYQVNGLSGGNIVVITVNPIGAACAQSAQATCTATACTPPTATIIYAGPFCSDLSVAQPVTIAGTGTYTGGTFTSTAGLSIDPVTGAITPSTSTAGSYVVTYTLAGVGGCSGITATTSVTINAVVAPTFNTVAPICSGAILAALPTTSLNGIAGTWTPALSNTATTTYTFTPDAGQCATTTTLIITVNSNITPTFNAIAPICSGATLAVLPTTSINGITGTWTPALNNTATTTYTFTPSAGQCATTTTLTITVNPIVSPNINCGVSTTNSVSFNWSVIVGATDYAISYTINGGAANTVGPIGNLLTYQVNGLSGGDVVLITVNPIAAACAQSAQATCTATACTPPTATISYAGPFCSDLSVAQPVTIAGTGTYTGGTFSSTAGLSIDPVTGAITPSTSTAGSYLVTYTLAGVGACPGINATASVIVTTAVLPTFNAIAPICSGAALAALPTTSTNGITGVWTPAMNNTATTTYTFTPAAGQCATATTLTITVNSILAPVVNCGISTFNSVNFGWSVVTGATDYLISYSVNGSANVNVGSIGNTLSYTVNGLNAGENVIITVMPNGTGCFTAGTASCSTTACIIPPAPTVNIQQPTCAVNTGSFVINSPTTGLNFSLDGAAFGPYPAGGYIGLNSGNHSLQAQAPGGCLSTIVNIAINIQPLPPVALALPTPASCANNDGVINVQVSQGTAPYSYSINGNSFQNSSQFNGLSAQTYTIIVRDALGCSTQVSAVVTINNPVTLDAGADLAICERTAILFNITSNAALFNWTPSIGLSDPSIKNPLAAPSITTTYIVKATDGLCVKTDTLQVIVRKAPVPDAGTDLQTCFGNSVRFDGKGGLIYQWTPAQYLSNPGIPNPVFTPPGPGIFNYALSVTDINGCKSLGSDTLKINVLPLVKVDAGRDTAIALNQPLQLNASDNSNSNFISYRWTPTNGLNNANIKNPIVSFNSVSTYVYTVKATTANGCEASDDITIKVYLKADIYVPNAFTPNHDGKNDLARPIAIGIKELKYFRLFNRWGELVFETKELNKGWDGMWKGVEQPTNTYVWMAQAVDFNGNLITKKGTITLVK